MNTILGIAILVLIVLGVYSRRREKKQWVAAERYDESGNWIDKRSGERGTYGSLDEEMERNRHYISRQGRINELAAILRKLAAERFPEIQEVESIKAFNASVRARASELIQVMETEGHSAISDVGSMAPLNHELAGLKKEVLDFAYKNYPALLEMDLADIKALDAFVAAQLRMIYP